MDKRPSARRVANVMQKQMLHSEHAALCYIEASRRDRVKKRKAKRRIDSSTKAK